MFLNSHQAESPLASLLTRRRLLGYSRLFAGAFAVLWLVWMVSGTGLLDRAGKPLGGDFVTFWAASRMTQEGSATQVYDPEKIHAAETEALDADAGTFAWHYPPVFLPFIIGLASLPYLLALVIWLALTASTLLFAIRRLLDDRLSLWLALAFPGVFQNATQGQTGFFSAAILGGGLLLMESSPFTGGVVLGLIAYKPQFMPLVLLAPLVSRRWRALAGVAVSSGLLSILSLLAFGADAWVAFFHDLPVASRLVYQGALPWTKMPTVSGALLLAGTPVLVTQVIQVVCSVPLAVVVAWLWRSGAPYRLCCAGQCVAAVLAAPFAFDYDLMILGVGLLLFGLEARATGWLRWEREVLILGWLLPISPILSMLTHVSVAPFVLAWLLMLIVRRAAIMASAEQEDAGERSATKPLLAA